LRCLKKKPTPLEKQLSLLESVFELLSVRLILARFQLKKHRVEDIVYKNPKSIDLKN